ncbi:SHOCT domain-containing protein [Clostridium beijerinckii]|uniref:SHOCT domain-containing protein n=1 Tax=Clostridium beijerinckii TaxID=1520 RepID=A0A1S9N570_CLOBE|nr:SHOCT domain-containing protein [Clostridium beijerinckii]MZK51136.1 SHOCT domain-containing protein [Clostridium beijerinckii]MZK59338.1 SHOCT domain-containing protein [Clostridium beijerinckii]MZK69457.1 SHOCT domain-containing protein [Clostridium beijerinckii]MZK74830.1 SHOCT domain-containing protein [Clostridium beijerinckii]MZK84548.1 SHOCT domain-containing protein [Clostridium beijerinckii]
MFCSGFGGYGGFGAASSIGYGGMSLAMGVRMLIFIALIVLAFKLFKNYTNKSNDAMKILNEKFAGGEITQEEYLKRKSVLSQKN